MKNWISISLHLLLWLVFLATPTSTAYACGNSCSKPTQSETKAHKKTKTAHCGNDCAKKCNHSNQKHSKKGCGDDCNCSTNISIIADLTQKIRFYFVFQTDFVEKSDFLYQQATPKSVIHAVWQPPITFLA